MHCYLFNILIHDVIKFKNTQMIMVAFFRVTTFLPL